MALSTGLEKKNDERKPVIRLQFGHNGPHLVNYCKLSTAVDHPPAQTVSSMFPAVPHTLTVLHVILFGRKQERSVSFVSELT